MLRKSTMTFPFIAVRYRVGVRARNSFHSVRKRGASTFLKASSNEFEKLIESLYVTRSLTNRTNELVTQTNHLKQINDVSSSLSNISLQLYEKLIKAGYAKSDSESKEIKSIFDEKIKVISAASIAVSYTHLTLPTKA
mgnify:CR=1 FL=1